MRGLAYLHKLHLPIYGSAGHEVDADAMMTIPHAMLPSSESLFNVCLHIIIACSGRIRVMAVGLEAKLLLDPILNEHEPRSS